MENTTPAPTELPHNTIAGLSGEQADKFVELAYENNNLADKVDSPDWLEALDARDAIRVNDARIQRLANLAMGKPEIPEPFKDIADTEESRRRPKLVVNPADGAVVEYGYMRHGNHPQGGRIVRR